MIYVSKFLYDPGIVDGIPVNIMEPYNEVNANFKATDTHPEIKSWMDIYYPKK